MTVQIAVRISQEIADTLDEAVERGEFATRTEAIRVALEGLARRLRESEIADEYRRAYVSQPQEDWIGELGLSVLDAMVATEKRTHPEPL